MEERKMPGSGALDRGEEFLQIFYKGAEFTKELMVENEKLRYKVLQLEEKVGSEGEASGTGERVSYLEDRVALLEQDKERLLKKHEEIEKENQDFADRYVEVQEENNNLANLYIASHQLHSTLDHREVLRIILEIVINLVGAETFCIMLLDEKQETMATVAAEGIEPGQIERIPVGSGLIGQVARTGDPYFSENLDRHQEVDLQQPMACVPLTINDTVIGLLVIYNLLSQKDCFQSIDFELFNLLAGHAATAIYSSELYSRSERKLSTIQGFLSLLSEAPHENAQ